MTEYSEWLEWAATMPDDCLADCLPDFHYDLWPSSRERTLARELLAARRENARLREALERSVRDACAGTLPVSVLNRPELFEAEVTRRTSIYLALAEPSTKQREAGLTNSEPSKEDGDETGPETT